MKGLLLAEKPSVMRAIQAVYRKEKNYPDTLEFGAFHGHLMGLQEPDQYTPAWADQFDTSILPMIPSHFRYLPVDEESVNQLLGKIRSGNYDFLINACDAAREGEHIFWSFYEANGLTLPVKRLWIKSVTEGEIQKALHHLQDAAVYDGLRQAAKYRAQFDWLVGMNFSRAAKARRYRSTPIGRVQSPTLKLIVDRERQIRAFVPQDFYEVKGGFLLGNAGPVVFTHLLGDGKKKETRYKTESEAIAVRDAVRPLTGRVEDVQENIKSVNAPTLYSLTELQKKANKLYRWKADKTLDIAQKLYENGWTTYPRTSSRFLPKDMIPEIPAHLRPIAAVPGLGSFVSAIGQAEIDAMVKKKYVDDAKVTDHHAIIPTDAVPDWNRLSADEQRLYDLICRSFLAIFLPPHRFSQTIVMAAFEKDGKTYLFATSGKVELEQGWNALYPSKTAKKQVTLPPCKKGDAVTVKDIVVQKGQTKAPERYSVESLLAAMQNAGQHLTNAEMRSVLREAEGLGTEATRAETLKKLEEREFIGMEKNQYFPTPSGEQIIDAVGDRDFCSPLLTAQWEKKLKAIEKGTFSGDFRAEMETYIKEETAYLLDSLPEAVPELGLCPRCKAHPVLAWQNSFCCRDKLSKREGACDWSFPRALKGVTLTNEDMREMLETWSLPEAVPTLGLCPRCKAHPVLAWRNNFCCWDKLSKREGACDWSFPRTLKGVTLTDDNMRKMLETGRSDPMVFKLKNGDCLAKLDIRSEGGELDWKYPWDDDYYDD